MAAIGDELYNALSFTRNKLLPELAGVDESGTLGSSPFAQLFIVAHTTGATVDPYDPYQEPTGGTTTTTLYMAIGKFDTSPSYIEDGGNKFDVPVGECVILGSLNASKTQMTRMTAAQLQAVFSPTTNPGEQKSFYFGDSFSKDTIDSAVPVIVEEVTPDPYLDAVVVKFRKATPRG